MTRAGTSGTSARVDGLRRDALVSESLPAVSITPTNGPVTAVVLVPHGGRETAANRCGRGASRPSGVCAGPVGPGVRTPRGRAVLIVHGTCDRMTNPADSYAFASRTESRTARLARFEVPKRADVWTRSVCAFALDDVSSGDSVDETLTASPEPSRAPSGCEFRAERWQDDGLSRPQHNLMRVSHVCSTEPLRFTGLRQVATNRERVMCDGPWRRLRRLWAAGWATSGFGAA
jgi:hypothetical protein